MKVFNLYNDDFIINDDFEKYNEFRNLFTNIAKEATSDFLDMYKQEIFNMDMLINKMPPYARELITNTISSEVIRILVQEGVMAVNTELFLSKYYYKYFDFDKYFDPILEKYVQITEAKDSLNSYREMQKASRSRWQGGGFGVKGAIKGAMTAGALNLGTDLLRSFGDSNTSRQDRNKINSMKEQIYNNPITISTLKLGIYNCIFGQFLALIDELVENDIIQPISLQEKEAKIILENTLKYDRNSPEKMLKNIIKSLRMNPYNFDAYELLIASHNDCNDLIEMAYYFGFDNKLETVLKEKYKEEINSIEKLPETNCDELFNKIMKYSELEKTSHIFLFDKIKSLSQKLIYLVESKKELAEYYLVLTEIFPNTSSDIQDLFVDKMNKNDINENIKENELIENYKCIDSKSNSSNIFTILKVLDNSHAFSFSQDGKKFAYVNNNSGIMVFNAKTFELETVLNGYSDSISIVFDENSDNIVEIHGNTITKWNIKKAEIVDRKGSAFDRILNVTYFKNKLLIGVMDTEVDNSCGIEVFDIDKMISLKTFKTSSLPGDLSASFDGRFISSIFLNNFFILDTSYGKISKSLIKLDENEEINSIKFSPNSSLIAYTNTNGIITVWDYSKNRSKCYLNCGNTDVKATAFSPNDRLLAVECSNNYIQLWDLEEQIIKVTLTGYDNSQGYLSFSPDGKLLISNDENTRLVIWSINDTMIATNELSSNVKDVDHNNSQINSENSNVNSNKNYCGNKTPEETLPKKSIFQWFNRLALSLIIFLGLALLAYNKIGNVFIKYGLVIFLVAAGIQSLVDSISELQEMNKKNNC